MGLIYTKTFINNVTNIYLNNVNEQEWINFRMCWNDFWLQCVSIVLVVIKLFGGVLSVVLTEQQPES